MARLRPRSGSSRLIGQHKLLFVTERCLLRRFTAMSRSKRSKSVQRCRELFGAAKISRPTFLDHLGALAQHDQIVGLGLDRDLVGNLGIGKTFAAGEYFEALRAVMSPALDRVEHRLCRMMACETPCEATTPYHAKKPAAR